LPEFYFARFKLVAQQHWKKITHSGWTAPKAEVKHMAQHHSRPAGGDLLDPDLVVLSVPSLDYDPDVLSLQSRFVFFLPQTRRYY
jgi:hypothetical protein